jgi:hypothetical protein
LAQQRTLASVVGFVGSELKRADAPLPITKLVFQESSGARSLINFVLLLAPPLFFITLRERLMPFAMSFGARYISLRPRCRARMPKKQHQQVYNSVVHKQCFEFQLRASPLTSLLNLVLPNR